jgi:chromosome segregation ATPase
MVYKGIDHNMDIEDTLTSGGTDKMITVVQNISTLDLTIYNQIPDDHDSDLHSSELSSNHPPKKEIPINREKILFNTDKVEEAYKNELNDRNLKIISVEIDFLKQSVSYLQSQIHSKSLEITSKDEKITKLEKIVEKQKRKLKDLKSKVKFQENKLLQVEQKLPKYQELLEKFKIQETFRIDLDEKYNRLEKALSCSDNKKNKLASASPKPKNALSPYRVLSPRTKKAS